LDGRNVRDIPRAAEFSTTREYDIALPLAVCSPHGVTTWPQSGSPDLRGNASQPSRRAG
jgi:hypothetical protein